MRAFAPAFLIAYSLLGVTHPAAAADKFKIEIVETTMTIGLVPHTDPGTPEHISTHCNRTGTDCDSTVIPATDPSSSLLPEILSFEAKAIFPDGSHVKLMCFPSRLNKKCGGIMPIAGSGTLDSANCFLDAMVTNAPAVGTTKSCTAKNLGFYQAKIDKNVNLVISATRKVTYQMKGSW